MDPEIESDTQDTQVPTITQRLNIKCFVYRIHNKLWVIPADLASTHLTAAVNKVNEACEKNEDGIYVPAALNDAEHDAFVAVFESDEVKLLE